MTVPVEKRRYTIAEYLAMEEKATDRHEFHDGEILAMSGGTYRHSRTNRNLLIALGIRLRGTPCEPLDSNMRVSPRLILTASHIRFRFILSYASLRRRLRDRSTSLVPSQTIS
jgi:Putative restriction endonuclease